MIKVILSSLLILSQIYGQVPDSIQNTFAQPSDILRFADYLFCERDYLRAADEYLRLEDVFRTDKINFKAAISYSTINKYPEALQMLSKIQPDSYYSDFAKLELMKILILRANYLELRNFFRSNKKFDFVSNNAAANKLYLISFLKDTEELPEQNAFLKSFDENEQTEAAELYKMKINPAQKKTFLASVLSAIIPGAGKFYCEEIGDGIFAFITTGLFTYLAYDNFKADHDFRGWLFTGLAAGFYAGNVYGSYASAQIYNAKVKFEFDVRFDSFLKSNNYFIPEYDFCK